MKKFLKSTLCNPLLIGGAVCFILTCGMTFHLLPMAGSTAAYAASENGKSHSSGKGHGNGNGHGPNPNCAYQDGSGRGGYAGSNHGKGHGSDDTATDTGTGTAGVDTTTSGGAPGGENFVCDQPGSWRASNKIYMNH